MWDVAERKIIREWKAASGRPTYYVAWAPDGDHLLAGGDPILTFRNVTTDQVVLESKNTIGWFQVAVALDGKSLGGILWNTQVLVFDRETHDMTSDFSAGQLEGMRAARMVFAPDGRLVTSGRGHFVDLWNPQSQTHLATFRGHSGQVIGIAVSPDGKWIASSGEDHEVRVWRMPPSQK